jgi:hypothetical protein
VLDLIREAKIRAVVCPQMLTFAGWIKKYTDEH